MKEKIIEVESVQDHLNEWFKKQTLWNQIVIIVWMSWQLLKIKTIMWINRILDKVMGLKYESNSCWK